MNSIKELIVSKLFSPLKIKDVTFRNRIGVSSMCQYSSIEGVATDWHLVHLGSRAVGGAGLIMAEATAVTAQGRITPGCAGIWNDDQVEALIPITAFMERHGAVPGVQIAHAGRKGSAARPWDGGQHLEDSEGGYETLAPGDEPFDRDGLRLWKTPKMMTLSDIEQTQDAFVAAARRSVAAGYKLLEIHAAHGYLLHSFFTPIANNRTDQYGGCFENRARMLLETTCKVREVWPENLPLAVRLSAADWDEQGLSIHDNVQMARWLKELGVDIVDCSAGGASPASRSSIGNRNADQIGLAASIREGADIMTMAVGTISDPGQAENIIASGQADIALIGREMLRDPYWPFHAAQSLGVDTRAIMPVQNAFFVG
ncbi:NADH:flavin oxidoreductase/NADH oxidase [Marinobacterium rhizophilum]|uniref:NADH:flavin oxidoreductase/NADH oxidase n=1 Tax=Marinobacterium rhizophilum TaxID=420402 RepID=A0ABY5HEG0_9GAMM|nr:NADH:flavin oxidoreductase/NADH oxidase [Marinobacterium rhizophilum]UTW10509.1 NADH:flavin oxidoreductase/NADH oxidase [Marinobacterium rhizophilum]